MNRKNVTKAEIWKSRITNWRESGMKQSRYCRENNLSLAVFNYWKRRLNGSNGNAFYRLPSYNLRNDRMKLILPGGITITFEKTSHTGTITRLVETLCGSTGTK